MRGRCVHLGSPWWLPGSFGVSEFIMAPWRSSGSSLFIGVRPGGRRVHLVSLG